MQAPGEREDETKVGDAKFDSPTGREIARQKRAKREGSRFAEAGAEQTGR